MNKIIRKKIKETIMNNRFLSMKDIIKCINPILTGWVNYYRVGYSSKVLSNIRDYVEKCIRRLLEKRTRKGEVSVGRNEVVTLFMEY
ncbi:group II intron maturase-specific domain-containing protein [Tepidibacter mesophilus]|uniref:group II intron maturase-specific domain-containing protein n=1 Tax=Tepidibacter mesophilus TaxID=655607 RepID=UPI0016510F0E|nr:group II intron maturase-specific domain-containing protein [Tepidibacter mesophilus]